MQLNQKQLLDYLESHNIAYSLYTHPPLFTCEQAAEIVAKMNIPGTGVKNLFLKDRKNQLYLISAQYDTRVDLKKIGKELGIKELRFANPTVLKEYLGVEPGSVTPLALIHDKELAVQAIIDTALLKQEKIQVHPLRNDATVVITPADLIAFFNTLNRTIIKYDFLNNEIVT